MRRENRFFIDSPWFIYVVVPIASGVLGVPVSVLLLTEADGNPFMTGMGFSFAPYCAIVGFLIFRLITWLGPSTKEENA